MCIRDRLLGCDAVVSVSPSITRTLNPLRTNAIINGRVEPVGVAGVHIGTVVNDSLLKKHLENNLDGTLCKNCLYNVSLIN